MGMDVYGKLIVGVSIGRSDFFVTEKHHWICENGHARPHNKAQFCEVDGNKFVQKPIETPVPSFIAWAKEKNQNVLLFWDYLKNTYYRNSDEIGIFCVDSISGGYGENDFALGFRIAHTDGRDYPVGVVGVSLELITAKAALVEKLARKLEIDRKAQIFLNIHIAK